MNNEKYLPSTLKNEDKVSVKGESFKEIAKSLCTCHHKCNDTKDCVVEEEALLLINENKSNNFDVKSNKVVKSTDWLTKGYSEEELARMKAEAIKEAEEELHNNELFKQALVEGVNRHFDKTIEEAKKIEQIEEMAKDICKLGISCEECTMLARKTNQTREQYCKAFEYAKRAYNVGYRKQSEGEWIDRYKGKYANSLYVCSICDGKSLLANHMNELLTPTVKQILTPYCPHCGAKMKGGEE